MGVLAWVYFVLERCQGGQRKPYKETINRSLELCHTETQNRETIAIERKAVVNSRRWDPKTTKRKKRELHGSGG